MPIKINNVVLSSTEFAYDGCHKIYLINSPTDKQELTELGYDIYPIDKLPETWGNSCSLRFISDADLKKTHISQFESASVTMETAA